MSNKPRQVFGPTINRIPDVMEHTERYAFGGIARLATDARVSASGVSKLIHGRMNPSLLLVSRVTAALEAELGHHIDPRDLVAESGLFLTRHLCDLVRCPGCFPERAYDDFGDLKKSYAKVQKGRWVTSRHPHGFSLAKGGL